MRSIGQLVKDVKIALDILGVFEKIRVAGTTGGGGGGGGGGITQIAIGDTIVDGIPFSVLYLDAEGKIQNFNPGFTFDETDFKINADITLTQGKKFYLDG